MPVYQYEGQFYDLTETDPAAAKAKIEAHLGITTAPAQPKKGILDFLPSGTPSWMQSKPGQGWDDANAQAAGGDVTNPMAYLSEAQKQEQGAAAQTTGQAVNRALQVGAGVAKGAIINPVAAAAQVVGGETGRQFASEAQKAYETQRANAGAEGFDWAQLGGSIVSPINRVLPGGGYTGGAIGAMTQPLEDEYNSTFDVLAGKAKQAAAGAVMGKVAENLVSALTPKLKEGVQELIDRGVQVSPGQAYEGVPGWLFRHMETLGLGPKTSTVNKQFNNVVANDVLSSIDTEVPKSVPAGQAAVRYAQKKISDFYDNVLTNLGTNKFDREYKDGVNKAITSAIEDVADPVQRDFITKRIVGSLNANIRSRVGPEGITGENLKLTQEWLKKQIEKVDGKSDVVNTSLKSGYSDILANLNQFISRIDKDGNVAKADAAWAKLYSFADASAKAVQTGGVFSPAQLAEAAKNQAATVLSKGGGTGALGPESQAYLNVLNQPDKSNWVYRVALASKAGTGVATAWLMPEIAIPVLLASGLTYAAAKQILKTPEKARIAMQKALENNAGTFGAAGQQLLNQIKAGE